MPVPLRNFETEGFSCPKRYDFAVFIRLIDSGPVERTKTIQKLYTVLELVKKNHSKVGNNFQKYNEKKNYSKFYYNNNLLTLRVDSEHFN